MNERINQALVSLNHSPFRSRFKLLRQDLSYIDRKGVEIIRSHAFDFVTSRVAPRYPKNDGKQIPMKNHPVFVAQHATTTCCRNGILAQKPGALRPVASSTLKHLSAFVFSAYGRKDKPPVSGAVVDTEMVGDKKRKRINRYGNLF
jgi:hypothetical protein